MMKLSGVCYNAAIGFKRNPPKSTEGAILSSLSDLDDKDMGDESVDLLVAGSDTTAYTLSAAVVQICQNSQVKKKLESESITVVDVRASTVSEMKLTLITECLW